jgi:hypothetical protein
LFADAGKLLGEDVLTRGVDVNLHSPATSASSVRPRTSSSCSLNHH